MSLITDKIKENSEKCKTCAFLILRNTKIDKHSVFYDEAIKTLEGFCNVCPFVKDFEKIYGMKPYVYFSKRISEEVF